MHATYGGKRLGVGDTCLGCPISVILIKCVQGGGGGGSNLDQECLHDNWMTPSEVNNSL